MESFFPGSAGGNTDPYIKHDTNAIGHIQKDFGGRFDQRKGT